MDKTKESKVKSFNDYANQVRTEKMVQKAYTDHLLHQLAEATHSPAKGNNEVLEKLNALDVKLNPVADFFAPVPVEPKPVRISKKQREQQELEEHEKMLEKIAIERVKQKRDKNPS